MGDFETEVCGRCGGSGQYSYCQRHGTTCFGCGGSGSRYTKRGAAAHQMYIDSLAVELGSLNVGDVVLMEDFLANRRYFATITLIEEDHRTYSLSTPPLVGIHIETTHAKYGAYGLVGFPKGKIRKAQTAEFKAARKAEALAYQATLTKAGKPRATAGAA